MARLSDGRVEIFTGAGRGQRARSRAGIRTSGRLGDACANGHDISELDGARRVLDAAFDQFGHVQTRAEAR